jgi:hypothetical protein
MNMNVGDKVYYHHTDKRGYQIKYSAIVLATKLDTVQIRVGRLNVMSQKIETFEDEVSTEKLSKRATPCSFEDELAI